MKLHLITQNFSVPIKSYLSNLSQRERVLIMAGLLTAFLMGSYMIYEPISHAFYEQTRTINELERDAKSVALLLERYAKLKAKRVIIESEYRKVEIKEGALSYLENLIKLKTGLSGGFTIREGQAAPLGEGFELASFDIRYEINDLSKIVDLLKEIVHGKQPMILGEIDLRKIGYTDRIAVHLDINSIRREG